ncbi:MAG TPA: hypothetical protein VFS32_07085 [Candidatus Limnocylindrales bacterium]|nr:hypothetical protein [Candidatus Limnocylindrales bacterium]
MPAALLPAVTSVLAFVFAVALVDQWRDRRRGYQAVWAVGMVLYGVASGCEALAAAAGWQPSIYRTWYAFGVATPAWLGLGTAYLLGRTRFGYTYAALVLVAGLIAFAARNRYAEAGLVPVALLFAGVVVALAVGVETYFQDERWPAIGALAVVVATIANGLAVWSAGLPATLPLAASGLPSTDVLPAAPRLLALFLNLPGALALVLGAIFSTYVFMPKRRVLAYSLDPTQPGDHFLFNLAISPVAILVNFVASLPGAIRALVSGRINSRAPATLLIALGAFVPTITDSLVLVGSTEWFQLGKFVGLVLLFAGFLVSIDVFHEYRVPFTSIRLGGPRREREVTAAEVAAPPRPSVQAADRT